MINAEIYFNDRMTWVTFSSISYETSCMLFKDNYGHVVAVIPYTALVIMIPNK